MIAMSKFAENRHGDWDVLGELHERRDTLNA
jgi:hypothetical protein